jgi:hypothetical protein
MLKLGAEVTYDGKSFHTLAPVNDIKNFSIRIDGCYDFFYLPQQTNKQKLIMGSHRSKKSIIQ